MTRNGACRRGAGGWRGIAPLLVAIALPFLATGCATSSRVFLSPSIRRPAPRASTFSPRPPARRPSPLGRSFPETAARGSPSPTSSSRCHRAARRARSTCHGRRRATRRPSSPSPASIGSTPPASELGSTSATPARAAHSCSSTATTPASTVRCSASRSSPTTRTPTRCPCCSHGPRADGCSTTGATRTTRPTPAPTSRACSRWRPRPRRSARSRSSPLPRQLGRRRSRPPAGAVAGQGALQDQQPHPRLARPRCRRLPAAGRGHGAA